MALATRAGNSTHSGSPPRLSRGFFGRTTVQNRRAVPYPLPWSTPKTSLAVGDKPLPYVPGNSDAG